MSETEIECEQMIVLDGDVVTSTYQLKLILSGANYQLSRSWGRLNWCWISLWCVSADLSWLGNFVLERLGVDKEDLNLWKPPIGRSTTQVNLERARPKENLHKEFTGENFTAK